MSDILIKNMEMPKERKMFVIEPDGSVWVQIKDTSYFCTGSKAVALPEHHGRLCDLDSLIEHETYNIEQALFDADEVLEDLKNTPVIVEATE